MKWILLLLLAPCALMDIRTKKISVWWNLLFLAAGTANQLWGLKSSALELLGAYLPGIGLLGIRFLFPGSIGSGDGLVFLAIGSLVGMRDSFFLLLTAAGLSFFFSLFLLLVKKKSRKYELPFIPFVFAAAVWNLMMT